MRSNLGFFPRSTTLALLFWSFVSFRPSTAEAAEDEDVRTYGDPEYRVEVEPHFSFGAASVYGGAGFGGGVRVSLPLVSGHLGRTPDNLAISFGGDIVHYEGCYFASYCGADYLLFPVAAQWNIFFHRKVSFFAEGGLYIYKGWRDECAFGRGLGCKEPSALGAQPSVAVGGRVHIAQNIAFTMRIGYPTMTVGFSFL